MYLRPPNISFHAFASAAFFSRVVLFCVHVVGFGVSYACSRCINLVFLFWSVGVVSLFSSYDTNYHTIIVVLAFTAGLWSFV